MNNLVFDFPLWYLLICALVATVYAAALYWREKAYLEPSPWLQRGLTSLRWLSVFIICLLFLNPVLRQELIERKAPIVVLAQDESQSIRQGMDSLSLNQYRQDWEKLRQSLSEKYDLRVHSFGESVRENSPLSFEDRATNISDLTQELYDLYAGQNLATVILATDGIYNQGNNPLYGALRLNVPFFCVALGDTIPKKDLVLRKVYNNQIAYLGDKFSVQADIAATNCQGSTQLQVLQNGQVVYSENLNIDNRDFFVSKEFFLEAKRSGMQRYTVQLTALQGEQTLVNNQKDFYIDVLDARQKILLLGESPHPDLAALRRLLEGNKNYDVQLNYAGQIEKPLAEYDFVVLHQLPSLRNNLNAELKILRDKKIPQLFIVGVASNIGGLNNAQNLLQIQARINQTNDVEGLLQNSFKTFTLNEKIGQKLPKFPPLTAPFGDFKVQNGATVVLKQKIGSVASDYPLLVLGEEQNTKKAVLAAEGIWKWRINDYMQHENHDIFDEFFGKLIQYLSNKEDKRRFRAFPSASLYNENESISLDAELYNDNYERINEPEALVEIQNEKGEKFPFTFNRNDKNSYTLKIGLLPVGTYRFEAKTSYNGQNLLAGGEFSVQAIQLEAFETTADHRSLANIAERSQGKLFYAKQLAEIAQSLEAQGYAKPLLFNTISTRSLIHLKWIFFLILGLLSLEWVARRYFGAY